MTTVQQITKKSTAKVFRKAFIKRRLTGAAGGYESDWFEITDKVKRWGTIKTDVDFTKNNALRISSFRLTVRNDDGSFNLADRTASLWNGFLTFYKTKIKIESGYLDSTGSIVPTTTADNTANYVGVLTDDIELRHGNEVTFNIRPLTTVFQDVNAGMLTGLTGSQTASDILVQIRDLVDSNSISVFGDFITTTSWNIETTTNIYTELNTSTVAQNFSMWSLMEKLAESENKVIYIEPNGNIRFRSTTANTTAVAWLFSGISQVDKTYGHTIKKINNFSIATSKIYTRIQVQIDPNDTTTSYVSQAESWTVGDNSNSWKYGERTFKVENFWLNTATAQTIATTLQTELSTPKKEIDISTKFIPALGLYDLVEVNYVSSNISTSTSLWGNFLWGKSKWDVSDFGDVFEVTGCYKVVGYSHNIDNFDTNFFLREDT